MVVDRERCRDAGMDDYLSKPVRLADVAGTLNQWLQQLDSPVPEVDVPDVGVLDETIVDGLRSLGPEFLAGLVPMFVLAAPGRLADIRSAILAGDTDALSAAAHALSGSAGNMGASGSQPSAVASRRPPTPGGSTAPRADLLALETELAQLLVAVSALVAVPA
jgi:CheY-like chemotaxis protein